MHIFIYMFFFYNFHCRINNVSRITARFTYILTVFFVMINTSNLQALSHKQFDNFSEGRLKKTVVEIQLEQCYMRMKNRLSCISFKCEYLGKIKPK